MLEHPVDAAVHVQQEQAIAVAVPVEREHVAGELLAGRRRDGRRSAGPRRTAGRSRTARSPRAGADHPDAREKRTRCTGASGPSVSVATTSPVTVSTTVTANRRMPGLWSVVSIAARAPSAERIPYHASCFVVNSRRGSAVPARSSAQRVKPEASTSVATAMRPVGADVDAAHHVPVEPRRQVPRPAAIDGDRVQVADLRAVGVVELDERAPVRGERWRPRPRRRSRRTCARRLPPSHTKAPMPETRCSITRARSPVPRTGRNATGCREEPGSPAAVRAHPLPPTGARRASAPPGIARPRCQSVPRHGRRSLRARCASPWLGQDHPAADGGHRRQHLLPGPRPPVRAPGARRGGAPDASRPRGPQRGDAQRPGVPVRATPCPRAVTSASRSRPAGSWSTMSDRRCSGRTRSRSRTWFARSVLPRGW